MVMNLEKLQSEIESDEGFMQYPYKDTRGYLTIGFGINLTTTGITKEEARWITKNRLLAVHDALVDRLPVFKTLDENRQRALVNMAYNMGIDGLLKFKKMIAALEANDYEAAADEAGNSLWATQVGDRAKRLIGVIRGI